MSSPGAVIAFHLAVGQTNEPATGFDDLDIRGVFIAEVAGDEVDNLINLRGCQSASLSDAERATRAKAIDDKQQLDRDVDLAGAVERRDIAQ